MRMQFSPMITLLSLASFLGSTIHGAQRRTEGSEQRGMSEVLVIGSLHAPGAFLYGPAYTPAHIRVALTKFRPTMVGVESNPLWFSHNIFDDSTYEAQFTAVPWAVEHNIPVHGVDWVNVEQLANFAQKGMVQAKERNKQEPRTLSQRHKEARELAAMYVPHLEKEPGYPPAPYRDALFHWYNSRGYSDAVRGWWESEGRTGPMVAEAGHRIWENVNSRDDHTVQQVLVLLRRYPGSRLAVVIGNGHKPDLDMKLGRYPDIRVGQLEDLPPITSAELEKAWLPLDALAGLRESLDGVLYYFNPEGFDRARVANLLNKLREKGIQTNETRYYEARWHALEGRFPQAQKLLLEVITGHKEKFAYRLTVDWNLTVQQMARIELGKVFDLQGQRAAAVAEYQGLLGEIEASPPPPPDDAAYQHVGDWATDGYKAFWTVFSYQAAREVLQMLIREPYSLKVE